MRVLFCGDRYWTDDKLIRERLEDLKSKSESLIVCHGGAKGADSIAGVVCRELGIECQVFVADWTRYGRAAGPIRNKQMLDEFHPDVVEAFHDDIENSKGTRNMVKQARARKIVAVVNKHLVP